MHLRQVIASVILLAGGSLLPAQQGEPAPVVTAASVWGANYFPNVVLTDHEGRQVRFFDDLIAGKAFVIDFIYTSCPDTCPLETARLAQVQSILGDRVGTDVFFYSITIDPQRDTAAVLANYAKKHGAGPGWQFLTGSERDIRLLRLKLGLGIPEEEVAGPKDHRISVLLGNQATGRFMKRSPFENAYVLAAEIGDTLHDGKTRPVLAGNDYATAPQLRNLTNGEKLFRTRCSSCHIIGQGDGLKRVGPDLLGVTERRERQWLARWIREPDVMLAEKDPTATGLFAAYGQMPMPNLRLEPGEVDSLIDFLATESRVVAAVGIKPVTKPAGEDDVEVESCCRKRKDNTLAAAADAVLARAREGAAPTTAGPASRGFRLGALSMASMGLGLLGLLTTAFARRRSAGRA